jgi:hypothetical protein
VATPAPGPTPSPEPNPEPSVEPRLADHPPPNGQPTPDPETTSAVQTALGTEHAAVWCYGLIAAFLSTALDREARDDLTAHRVRRDATIRLLTDSGVRAEVAQPAYRVPVPVTDQASAIQLAVTAESDAAAAWYSVLERCDDHGLRRMALEGLTDAAVRGARWSGQLNPPAPIPPFPGRPGPPYP